MPITAIPGPAVNYGITLSSSGIPGDYNEERGPSLNDLGEGTLDPRAPFCYRPGNAVGTDVYGWPGCFGGPAVDFMPIALNTSGIAALFTSTGSSTTTPVQVTLQTSANSSSFRTIPKFIPSTYSTPVSVVMLDGYQGGVAVGQGSSSPILGPGCGFGTANTINIWNPLIMGGRCLTITNSSGTNTDAGTTYVIKGFDCYGMAMSCTIAGGGVSSTVTTPKAFKYILSSGISFTASATNAGTGTAISIGVADVFGFPLYVDHPSYATVWVGPSSGATISVGGAQHTFGYGSSVYGAFNVNTTGSSLTAFSSLGDVRGTYGSSLATSGNTAASGSTGFRITMNISPKVLGLATISQNSFWGLVGLPQA